VRIFSILLLAVGLAMDATAVAATRGLLAPRIRLRHVLMVAVFFGGFQTLMPLLGWVLGEHIGPWVKAWDHWIIFVLLGALGVKMLIEARSAGAEPAPDVAGKADRTRDVFDLRVMLMLAIATSIDALAAGITLPLLDAPPVATLATIGITTALLSVMGLFLGRRFGAALGSRLDTFGGLVLIGLGTKTLIEHLLEQ
jgi:manganese efflux pump family protein